jgi:DNA-binding transcriptional LysR family regulator
MDTPLLPKLLAVGLLVGAGTMHVMADDNPLVAERWQTRPLVVVIPRPEHPMLRDLQSQLRDPAMQQEFQEREMALFTVAAGRGQRAGVPMTPAQTNSLLVALSAAADGPAQIFLIGKDGGVKLREGGDRVSLPAIFTLIDGMPMRRR